MSFYAKLESLMILKSMKNAESSNANAEMASSLFMILGNQTIGRIFHIVKSLEHNHHCLITINIIKTFLIVPLIVIFIKIRIKMSKFIVESTLQPVILVVVPSNQLFSLKINNHESTETNQQESVSIDPHLSKQDKSSLMAKESSKDFNSHQESSQEPMEIDQNDDFNTQESCAMDWIESATLV